MYTSVPTVASVGVDRVPSGSVGGMSRILITGAQGLLGQAVVTTAKKKGMHVRAWAHRKQAEEIKDVEWISGDIQDVVLADTATRDIDAVIHLAARKRDEPDSHDVNVDGSRILAEAARRNGVPAFVYVSTQSVKLRERGLYAQTKLDGEEAVKSVYPDAIILRPSLLLGNEMEGLIGTLMRAAGAPMVPIFGAGDAIFRPMHTEDLADALVKIAMHPDAKGKTLDAGGQQESTFNTLIKLLRTIRGSHGISVHLPVGLGLFIAKMSSVLPRPPITRSNVIGGSEVVPMDITEFTRLASPSSRDLKEMLTESWHRSNEKAESALLLRYVGADANPALEQRYRTACSVHGVTKRLSSSTLLLPLQDAWTRLYDQHGTLQQKLLIAAAVHEASTQSADALLPRNRSIVMVILHTLWTSVMGIGLFVLAHLLILTPSRTRHGV